MMMLVLLLSVGHLAGRCEAGAGAAPVMAVGAPYDEEPAGFGDPSRAQSCAPVPIDAPMCAGILYNTTASYVKQKEVAVVLQHLDELVHLNCAPYLRLFACSMHLPFCNRDQSLLVRPCQEFCQSVRSLCIPALRKFGYDWPPGLACETLPLEAVGTGSNRKNLCLRPNAEEFNAEANRLQELSGRGDKVAAATGSGASTRQQPELELDPLAGRWPNASSVGPGVVGGADADGATLARRRCSAAEMTIGGQEGGWCARRCMASFLFAREDREFADAWMLAWSLVCLVCTGLALATFALDSRRFRYPERPVVWVAACHLVHSGAHLLRAALGPELACSRPSGGDLALVSRHAGQWCAAVFLLLYFSWLAGLLWWLALALCWHLSAVRRWGHQLLAERAVWLHLLAWGAPLMLSVVLLVLHRIEGDELTHLCVIDGSRGANLLMFHVAPVATALVLGLAFLASALRAVVSAARGGDSGGSGGIDGVDANNVDDEGAIRQPTALSSPVQPHQQQRQQWQPLRRDRPQAVKGGGNDVGIAGGGVGVGGLRCVAEQQAAKISLFSFLFVLPTACVLAVNVYELLERHKWTASLEAVLARPGCVGVDGVVAAAAAAVAGASSASSVTSPANCGLVSRPSAVFYMLKIFMSLTAGLPAGLLVWANGQSASAWRRCLCRALTRRRSAYKAGAPQHQPQQLLQLHQLPQHHQQLQQQQQQQQQPQQPQQQHQYQQYQQYAYASVDSVRCDPRVAAGRPAKMQHHLMTQQQQHQHQQACMSDV